MIVFNDVWKMMDSFQLKGVSASIPDGYICALAGQNGAGKTTFLNLLLGLYRQDKGTLMIDGMNYSDDEKTIHDLMGAVLVDELMNAELSLKENGLLYGGYYSRFDNDKYTGLLLEFNLQPKTRFGRLSKGEKLKCQFAFALACEPKYLVLDEPTANFDPEFRQDFLRLISDFVADGKRSVILASHLMDDLDRYADNLIYFDEGNLVYSGDIESFRDKYRIVSGEKYKINLINKDNIIHMEERKYGAKALVRHGIGTDYDKALQVTYPSLEEFMYYYSKRVKR
ncbi:MAG: ABC transporter ATP-binding protein [Lachnospira sp.]|nr:ABC transporter ATP-binding protein [Lachnospira sp.]